MDSSGNSLNKDLDDAMLKLLWNLDTSSLLQLKQFFHKLDEDSCAEHIPKHDAQKHREKRTLYISQTDFEEAVNCVFSHTDFKSESMKLFKSLDVERSGFIWWEHFLDQLVEYGDRRTRRNLEGWSPVKRERIRIIDAPHCKKECISFVVPVETEISFCYVMISKYGKVGIYDGKLKLLSEYDVFFVRTGVNRRVRDIWITAAIYLEDAKTLIIAASDRSLMIYDSTNLYHIPIYLITGMPYISTFMAYTASMEKTDASCLVMGDDHGGITLITFKQPRVGLFFKHIQDKMNNIVWMDLYCILQEPYCEIRVSRRLHTRPVKKLVYVKLNDSIISCSNDPNTSLIIRQRKTTREPYVFKVNKGISCFHYSVNMNVLLTGSSDGRVRIWNPMITNKPTAVLPVQNASIMDVVVMSHLSAAITFNKNGEIKIWDILNTVCTQSLHIAYPSFGILGRLIQFGPVSIYPGPGRKGLKTIQTKSKTTNKQLPINCEDFFAGEESSKVKSLVDDEENYLAYEKIIDKEKFAELNTWDRPEILVACCNHIAVVPIQDITGSKTDKDSEYNASEVRPLLPPPEKSHRPRRPSVWKEDQVNFNLSPSILGSSISSNIDEIHLTNGIKEISTLSEPKLNEGLKYRVMADTDDMSIEDLLKRAGLTGLLEKDFVKEFGIVHDMNARLARQRTKLEKMRLQIAQGAPYSTLELQDPVEIKFSTPLPLSTRMQKKTGLNHFTEPQQILRHNSCFSMSTPRSSYTLSSTDTSKKSNISLDKTK